MTCPLKINYKLFSIQFTLPRYEKGDCIAFIRYAWIDTIRSAGEQNMIAECNELIFESVKRKYQDAISDITKIVSDTDIITLRNQLGVAPVPVLITPEFDPTYADVLSQSNNIVPIFEVNVYSCGSLTNQSHLPDFDIGSFHYDIEVTNHNWEHAHTLADFSRKTFVNIKDMMDSSLPGITYPLKLSEIHEGDYFYTNAREVAKVREVNGSMVKMSDGVDYYYSSLRPLPVYYLDTDILTNNPQYESTMKCILSYLNKQDVFAHTIQQIVREKCNNIETPLVKTYDFAYIDLMVNRY